MAFPNNLSGSSCARLSLFTAWGNLGHLGANLGPIWANLGSTWCQLGPTWLQLGLQNPSKRDTNTVFLKKWKISKKDCNVIQLLKVGLLKNHIFRSQDLQKTSQKKEHPQIQFFHRFVVDLGSILGGFLELKSQKMETEKHSKKRCAKRGRGTKKGAAKHARNGPGLP